MKLACQSKWFGHCEPRVVKGQKDMMYTWKLHMPQGISTLVRNKTEGDYRQWLGEASCVCSGDLRLAAIRGPCEKRSVV